MSTPAATVMVVPSPAGSLQARAKQVSAKAKTMPPWAMPNPLSISSRRVMRIWAWPYSARSTVMPIQREVWSPARIGWPWDM